MEALEHAEDRTLLVLNKADPNVGITTSAIESHLRHEVFAEIPRENRIVLHSVNHGVPYVLIPNLDRRHPLVQQTKAFAERLLEALAVQAEEGDESPPERPLGRLFQ